MLNKEGKKEGKKSGAERTQIATRNEEWSDERLQSFLSLEPPEGMPTDYNILLKSYRGMTAELFARFIPLYIEDGRDLNVALADGSTFLDLVSQHRKSTEYAQVLEEAGAVRKSA
ncbi:MAG: PA4642 family protein [Proteobacteria bacterium]|nr:PA4642 family protein [Pseudomonadota bacterium]